MDAIKEEPTVEEEISHEEEEGETRCVCGEIDPPDESGLYIQCERCSVWQHGSCVGIADGEDSHVEKYWCEQCKPELHHLYTVDSTGATRSIYRPVAERRRSNRRNHRHADVEQEGSEQDRKSDEEATEGSSPSSSRSRGSRGSKAEPASYMEGKSSGGGKSSRDDDETGDVHPDGSVSGEEGDRRLQDRKRATFSAREEKQYQLMLEKAIRESRRTSQQGADAVEENEGPKEDPDAEPQAEDRAVEQETTGQESGSTGDSNNSSMPQAAFPAPPSPLPEKPTPSSVSRSSNSTSEEDTKKRPGSRRSQRVGKASKKTNTSSSDSSTRTKNNAARSKGEIAINKPMKPRIPPQRTSLNEMRRRVSAILEFISRTQWELSESHSSKEDLVRFVENQQFVDQIDSIFEKFDHSFKLMDDLTRSLLLWEKKYSSTANTQE